MPFVFPLFPTVIDCFPKIKINYEERVYRMKRRSAYDMNALEAQYIKGTVLFQQKDFWMKYI